MQKLTEEILLSEYYNWYDQFQDGRNNDDLRFGQYLHITYDTFNLTDVFYTENATDVFNILHYEII
jgi:hypothetical protein